MGSLGLLDLAAGGGLSRLARTSPGPGSLTGLGGGGPRGRPPVHGGSGPDRFSSCGVRSAASSTAPRLSEEAPVVEASPEASSLDMRSVTEERRTTTAKGKPQDTPKEEAGFTAASRGA